MTSTAQQTVLSPLSSLHPARHDSTPSPSSSVPDSDGYDSGGDIGDGGASGGGGGGSEF